MMVRRLAGLPTLLVLLGIGVPSALAQAPGPAADEFFEKQVRPLLAERCLQCHGDIKPKGGLRLTSRSRLLQGGDSGPAALAGKPDESLIIKMMRSGQMPPKKRLIQVGVKPVTQPEIDKCERWIELGAPEEAAPG